LKPILSLLVVFTSLLTAQQASAQYKYPFQNPNLPVEQRISNVLSLMTLQEKIDFLGESLNVPRLGIHASGAVASPPGTNGQFEALHGITVGGPGKWGKKSPGGSGKWGGDSTIPTTQFPQSVGLGETWDPVLLQQAAAEVGYEARYIFQSVDRGGLILRSPNADLARDPRWGRSEESYGEDPYFDGTMAAAFVKGLQGNNPQYWQSAAIAKHFMANSNEDNRDASSSNFDARLLHEYYARPFQMAIEQGGANAYMASYNAVNGVPMTANPLLRDLTMKSWGFNGLIDSDRGAITYMVTKHKYYPNIDVAVAGAIHAGVNQILNEYELPVKDDLQDKIITEADINRNLAGVFRVLVRLGVLDPPAIVPYAKIKADGGSDPWDTKASKELALDITRESIVLLKNSAVNNAPPLLPLDASKLKSIAVVGPFANEVDSDFYGGTPPFAITPVQGIQDKVGSTVAVHFSNKHDDAVQMAKSADVAIVLVGNQPTCSAEFGHCPEPTEGKEAVDRKIISLKEDQEKLIEDVYAANPRTIVVLIASFPYTINWAEKNIPAILHMAHSSEEEGAALADVIFGDYNPAGRLVVTWPQDISQLPPMMDYDITDGRTYMYFKDKPLYPFGYGLSYTEFKYSDMHVSSSKLPDNGAVTVSIKVTNTGKRPGDEVVQLYVQHIGSRVVRAKEELKGFKRVSLAAGETKTVDFQLPAKNLAYWDEHTNNWAVEKDQVRVMIGSSSAAIQAEKMVTVTP